MALDLHHWDNSVAKIISEMVLRWETYGNSNQFICIKCFSHELYTMPLRLLWDPHISLTWGILRKHVQP